MSKLELYNSLTRQKEEFQPLNPDHVRLYACGPTVYSYAHIGNARMAVVFDLLTRLLRRLYPKVTYVSNITDIDDKIIKAALETRTSIEDITSKYAAIYNEDMEALGVQRPDIQPLATVHLAEMIALIEALIERGHAYEAKGHVLFHVPSFPAYGALSGRSRDEQVAGARVEVAPFKNDPADFVLWKPSRDDQPGWESPWGRGRPGWHIECSAMAEKHLGLPFDIHGGGADLKFPHHENEIAQSCCAHGYKNAPEAFARYWVHNGFVTVEGEKMAKSIGNIRLVHDLIKSYKGEVLRLTLLSAHYQQPLDWSETTIGNTNNFLTRIYNILKDSAHIPATEKVEVPAPVMAALCDDLNTPGAIAEINNLAKALSKAIKEGDEQLVATCKAELLAAGNVMGILQEEPESFLGYAPVSGEESRRIDALVQEREQARKNRDFVRADEIRDELSACNIVIEDTPSGPKWRRVG